MHKSRNNKIKQKEKKELLAAYFATQSRNDTKSKRKSVTKTFDPVVTIPTKSLLTLSDYVTFTQLSSTSVSNELASRSMAKESDRIESNRIVARNVTCFK